MATYHANSRSQNIPQCTGTQEDTFFQAVISVLSVTLVMILVTWSGLFDSSTVELGLEHYAETHLQWVPDYIPMPLNTMVNFGYILCGLYWIHVMQNAHLHGTIKDSDLYFFFVFNTLGYIYGFVQVHRIVWQTRGSAIMDQWYTLPFFMLVFVWAQSIRDKCTRTIFYGMMYLSVLSYSLTLLTPIGFELSLGCHILLAVTGSSLVYWQNPSRLALRYFFLAFFSCSGFVVLKLVDRELPHIHWIFSYVSGHFLSKMCDVLQLHFVNCFFFTIVSKVTDPVMKRK